MTRILTLVVLTGILAIPLCSSGSVPSSSRTVRTVRKALRAPTARRTTLITISRVRSRQRGLRCKTSPRTPPIRTSREEPAVVILYGDRPWSWM
jgi:hypothetical protein